MINLITTGAERYHNFWIDNLHSTEWEDEYFSSRGKVVERSATFSHNVPLYSTSRLMYALSELDGFTMSDNLYKSVYIFTMHPDPFYAMNNLHLIDDDVISAARSGDCLIVIDNSREAFPVQYDVINSFVSNNKIENSLVYLTANMEAESNYREWLNGKDSIFSVLFVCDARINASRQFVNGINHGYKNKPCSINIPSINDCLLYRSYSPVVSHCQRLNKSEAIDREISYGYLSKLGNRIVQTITNESHTDLQYYPNLISYRCNSKTSKTDTHIAISAELQYNSIFTLYNSPSPAGKNKFVSAGFFNPMWFYQPVLLFAQPGTINSLMEQGFYMLEDVVDLSFDKEINHERRLKSVLDITCDLCNYTKPELISLINKDGLVHNKELIKSQQHLHKLKEYIFNFFSK